MIGTTDEAGIEPLTNTETDAVSGGLLPQLLAAYAVANIAWDFYQGFRDGAAGTVAQ